ncbi:MAG: hypothetical protein A2X32_11475 [Elusimicrobia bacterium GWC2_64_44]|nr:MAG: hypothetical protein A2X32_11475 [Elusimicrobia bacterium GWC2_64_44]
MKILFAFLALLLAAAPARARDLNAAAAEAARQVAAEPGGLPELFDKTFFRHISLEELRGLFAGLYAGHGAVERVVLVSSAAASGHFFFDTDKGYRIPAALSVAPESGLITGLFFQPAYLRNAALRSVRADLAALPGRKGFLARRLGEKPEDLEELGGDEHFAVGPAFKLYVLGALVRAGVPWDRVFRLREEDKSPPSGRLRAWPDGSPLTAHTLAALMLSESDDTASDALITALGRRKLEDSLAALGDPDSARLRPFLKTSEMFKLKSDTAAALKYLNLPAAEKYRFLDALAGAEPGPAKPQRSPFGVGKLGWFASPADLCRVMEWLEREGGTGALELLALDPGLGAGADFLYAGYRGGSEPGVLSATWLLKNDRSQWYCLSASWNDEKDPLDADRFSALMREALAALAAADRAPAAASAGRARPAGPPGP